LFNTQAWSEPVNLGQIEAVYHIMRHGTFGAAARELHVTQSALSHRVRALEDAIGAPLFIRGRRRISVTPLGEEIAVHVERIFQELAEIKKRFGEGGGDGKAASLRVAATSVGTAYLYGEFFERFIELHPSVDLQILGAETVQEAIVRVHDWRADAAFTAAPAPGPLLEAVTLGAAEIVLIASPSHPVVKLRRPGAVDLRKWPYVRHLPGAGARMIEDQVFLQSGGFPRILSESSDTEYIKRIVSLGLGLSLVPLFTVTRELHAGTLKALRLRERVLMQEFGLVYRKSARPAIVDQFATMCRDICRQSPKHYVLGKRSHEHRSYASEKRFI
jgi:DNA-binding transcriptional LysR family regulator